MLFDLKGRRKYVVQATYLLLALLMGGGLVLFGIGSDAGQGGLVDAFTDDKTGDNGDSQAAARVEQAEGRLRANPRDPAALTAVIRGHYQLATAKTSAESTSFPPEARADLGRASDAWQRYLALELPRPDDSLAGLMLQVYGPSGLGRADQAARAAEIVADARPSASAYLNVALYAKLAGQERKAKLAERQALARASSPKEKKAIKEQLTALDALASQQAKGGPAGQVKGPGGGAPGGSAPSGGGAAPPGGGAPGGSGAPPR
ncbi:MAG: hypothetical protein ACR2LY_07415 [Thermoleophilaceae bacterium]